MIPTLLLCAALGAVVTSTRQESRAPAAAAVEGGSGTETQAGASPREATSYGSYGSGDSYGTQTDGAAAGGHDHSAAAGPNAAPSSGRKQTKTFQMETDAHMEN